MGQLIRSTRVDDGDGILVCEDAAIKTKSRSADQIAANEEAYVDLTAGG